MKKRIKTRIQKLKKTIYFYMFRIVNLVFSIFPLKTNRVLFLSDQRNVLGGNLKCLYDYMDDKEYERIVLLKANTLRRRTFKQWLKLIYNLSVSKYIILDDWNKSVSLLKRRKNQVIAQLWHGAGAYKTFGYSRVDRKKRNDRYGHRNYTKAIVTSEDIRKCYAEGFGMDIKNIKATGFPRTDCFFDKDYVKKVKDSFYKEYPKFKNKKIVIFAPTYRGTNLAKSYYDFEMLNLDKIEKELGKDYVFIIKWHPAIYDKIEIKELFFKVDDKNNVVYDFSNKRDINDLLLISDVLVTDYSSVIFDYYLVNKPVVYYTYDLKKYTKDRGFYFPFEDYLYGEIAKNPDDLIKMIKKENLCNEKRKEFGKKFMSACDGKSTEKTYNYIFKEK